MTRLNLSRYALSVSFMVLLAGCGGSQMPIGAPAAPQGSALVARPAGTHNYKVLYSFGATADDGSGPRGSLVDVGGTLYGVTEGGGANQTCGYSPYFGSCGTVFSITTGGTEEVLYSFGAPPDGNGPDASLLDVHGKLYGTTSDGGSYECSYATYIFHCGTVFSVTRDGTEKVLHSFGAPGDGVDPAAPLIKVKGVLYGTTAEGGANLCYVYYGNCGTVFSITTGGTETVLHSFGHGVRTGRIPVAGLVDVDGTLYGTTYKGGGAHCRSAIGCGTVFSITTSGKEKLLHRFGHGTDGIFPAAALVNVGGILYGTTVEGGAHGYGTVFSITTGGTEKVLYSFGAEKNDARNPVDLIDVSGTLYGTSSGGGGTECFGTVGCGTLFSVTTRGKEKVLHDFSYAGYDGVGPDGLLDVSGTLYGTTNQGGKYGYGTVFELTP